MKTDHFLRPCAALVLVTCLTTAAAAPAAASKPPAGTKPATTRAKAPASRPSAATVLKGVAAPAGYEMTLFAAPPEVNYPTCLAATPRGDLFVGIDDQGSLGKDANRGRIVRCVDSDDDGVMDEMTTFAKVDHPRGLVWDDAARALYVLHPPMLTRYDDDDADGVADRSTTLASGLWNEHATNDRGADHTTNGIRLGIDGWIYIAVGDFGIVGGAGRDGSRLQMHGGGIARIRPDGSDLEAFATGMRNIYDVGIDPFMNVFTRDNTNDGDGWNDRVTFTPPGAYHGYPSRFRRFPREIVDAMIDTGGGSPCGVLFVDEPALPQQHRHAFFTVEWGQNRVDRHPLEPRGAGFRATTEKLMELPRGTDMDVDGRGRLFVSSWANGRFQYSDENVGYVIRLAPGGASAQPAFPDLRAESDAELLEHLAAPSGVRRQAAQREILRRADSDVFAVELPNLAASADTPLAGRVAAVFTLKLLLGGKADDALRELAKRDELREFALRALADRAGDAKAPAAAAAPFVAALRDPSPRVRLIAAWALGRLGARDAAEAIVPLTTDADPLVAHVAVNSLVRLNAVEACLAAVTPADSKRASGAADALQQMHDPAVVSGLAERLGAAKDSAVRGHILRALCRLYFRERPWDGVWWGTRPDTTGPYFIPVAWEQTPRIAEILRGVLAGGDAGTVRALLIHAAANRVDLPEVNERLLSADVADGDLAAALLDSLAGRKGLSDRQIAALRGLVQSPAAEPPVRARALAVLVEDDDNEAAIEGAFDVLGDIAAADAPPRDLAAVLESFIQSPQHAKRIPLLSRVASGGGGGSPARREVALAALLSVVESKLTKDRPRKAARAALDDAWADPAAAVPLLHAVGRTKAVGYADEVRARLKSPDPAVARAAAAAANRLGIKPGDPAAAPAETVAKLGYDQSLAAVLNARGDVARGKELFTRQGCVACHTVAPDEPPKGPFLGGIATRYSRGELFESIHKPSARIAQGFETQWFKTRGDVLEGFVTREAGEEIEIRDVNGKTILLKKPDVKARGTRQKSVMPEELVANLSPTDVASLIAFLESLKAK